MQQDKIFEWAVDFVLEHEGDYIDDDQDPGGETNFGVSQVHHPEVDVPGLDRIAAIRFYQREYWERYRCEALHPAWGLAVFDGTVNQPAAWIIRQLQETVGATVDGVIGPQTIGMANLNVGTYAIQQFMVRRTQRYITRPHFARFGNGWLRRVLDCYAVAVRQLG